MIEGAVTLSEFLNMFKQKTGLSVTLLFHAVAEQSSVDPKFEPVSGNLLYDATAWTEQQKKLYSSKLHVSLTDWIRERYEPVVEYVLPQDARMVQLQVSCTNDDDEPFKVPTVVYRF